MEGRDRERTTHRSVLFIAESDVFLNTEILEVSSPMSFDDSSHYRCSQFSCIILDVLEWDS
jgi:hypothetical protein